MLGRDEPGKDTHKRKKERKWKDTKKALKEKQAKEGEKEEKGEGNKYEISRFY